MQRALESNARNSALRWPEDYPPADPSRVRGECESSVGPCSSQRRYQSCPCFAKQTAELLDLQRLRPSVCHALAAAPSDTTRPRRVRRRGGASFLPCSPTAVKSESASSPSQVSAWRLADFRFTAARFAPAAGG